MLVRVWTSNWNFHSLRRECKLVHLCGKPPVSCKVNICLPYNQAVPFLDIYTKK